MGEAGFEERALVAAVRGAMEQQVEQAAGLRVSTPGGRFQVRWDEGGSASALGQLAFFAEFLEVSGLFEHWVEGCPMGYTSPNAPQSVRCAKRNGPAARPGWTAPWRTASAKP